MNCSLSDSFDMIILAESYLIVITERECVGSYLGHPIFKVSKLKVFPCDHSVINSPDEQVGFPFHFYTFLVHFLLSITVFVIC